MEKGKSEILKKFPKWRKSNDDWITDICDLATIVERDGGDYPDYNVVVPTNRVSKGEYYIELDDLLKLPYE